MKRIKIGNKAIGSGSPTFIIAEAGANWKYTSSMEKNFNNAKDMIDIAAKSGADAVKFQVYKAEKLYVENAGNAEYIGKEKPIYEIIKEMELPYEWLKELKSYCDSKNIIFMATPFDEDSADVLNELEVPIYKIASYTISHLPLIEHIASFNKPVILSTGASDLEDISEAIRAIKKNGNKMIALTQCTAKYPAPLDTINLKVIPELKKRFKLPVGLSDHSREFDIAPLGAVALGADIIEKHFTVSNKYEGPDHGFAILPDELVKMVSGIRKMEKARGRNGKKTVQPEEKELYSFCRRAIYSSEDISKGSLITQDNVAVLRSGNARKGLAPVFMTEIMGKTALKKIKKGSPINWKVIR